MSEFENMELRIAKFLRFGVVLSGIMIAVGWIMNIKWGSNVFFNFEQYDPIPLINLIEFHIMRKNWGAIISYAGLSVLISLPLIRVLLTGILFIYQKDYLLAFIACLVLLGLLISFSFGIIH